LEVSRDAVWFTYIIRLRYWGSKAGSQFMNSIEIKCTVRWNLCVQHVETCDTDFELRYSIQIGQQDYKILDNRQKLV
jgi:hypothetical protein